jgi:hypothetical protein
MSSCLRIEVRLDPEALEFYAVFVDVDTGRDIGPCPLWHVSRFEGMGYLVVECEGMAESREEDVFGVSGSGGGGECCAS